MRCVLLENVAGLVTSHYETPMHVVTTLRDLGFRVWWKIMQAEDCGLPHHRARLFIVAVLAKHEKGDKFPWPEKLPRPGISSIFDPMTRQETRNNLNKCLPPPSQRHRRKLAQEGPPR